MPGDIDDERDDHEPDDPRRHPRARARRPLVPGDPPLPAVAAVPGDVRGSGWASRTQGTVLAVVPAMLVMPARAEPVTRTRVPGRVPPVVAAGPEVPAATATATVIVHAATPLRSRRHLERQVPAATPSLAAFHTRGLVLPREDHARKTAPGDRQATLPWPRSSAQ